jgi:hypothetical protein
MSAYDFWILFEETGDISYYLIYRERSRTQDAAAKPSAGAD